MSTLSSMVKHISRCFLKPRIRRPIQQRRMSSISSSSPMVKHVSECFIKPSYEDSKRRYYLAPLDMTMLSFHYMQIGLVFPKPTTPINDLLDSLKISLSKTLQYHYYPLAGQLATDVDEDQHQSLIFVDCHKGLGAKFIHTSALTISISDILTPVHVPYDIVHPLFDHYKAINHDGHSETLLSVQVTELYDGVFISCSMNHVLGDGTSFWNFWKVWSETHRALLDPKVVTANPPPPITDRWFPEGYGRAVTFPFTHPDEFLTRREMGQTRTRFFHFSYESLARLKSKSRKQGMISNNKISTTQALCALFWRAYVRANRLSNNDLTSCILVANDRQRLNPPLSPQYFGNFIEFINTKIKVSDLLNHNLGWAASLLNHSVANHDDEAVRGYIQQWYKSPYAIQPVDCFTPNNFMLVNSPRFDVYGNDFGFGKPLAVRSGNMLKFGGVVVGYPGFEGDGSIDLEICLSPGSMTVLESDQEFMNAVSV